MTYRELCDRLHAVYDSGEARAVVRLVLEERFGLSMADILCDKVTELSADDRTDLEKIMLRLLNGEPVQYVLGEATFCGRKFRVGPDVLIPRPETEELCRWMTGSDFTPEKDGSPRKILDIGTGSGCIAITLAAESPLAQVTAWDISEKALAVARENAETAGVSVFFEQRDILKATADRERWQFIVSNPPYVCEKEKTSMKPQVFEHEPTLALFVPDDDPLRFYRAIANYAQESLSRGGWLYLEINPDYAADIEAWLATAGFGSVEVKADQFHKLRFVRAKKD